MTAVDGWVRLLTALANRVPGPFRRGLSDPAIRSWAVRIHDCVQLSAAEADDCECRTGGHRTDCHRTAS